MAFQQSSCNITLNGTVLKAVCQRAHGESDTESSIDLNSYIANDDGQLVQQSGGNFGATCSNIQLKGGNILACQASKIDGSKVDAQIDLSSFVSNNDGQLQVN